MGIHAKKMHSELLNGQLIRLLLLTTILRQVSDDFLNETQLTASVLFLIKWPCQCPCLLKAQAAQCQSIEE